MIGLGVSILIKTLDYSTVFYEKRDKEGISSLKGNDS